MRNFQWGTALAVAAGVLIAGLVGGVIARAL
jgi:hypothetical protein